MFFPGFCHYKEKIKPALESEPLTHSAVKATPFSTGAPPPGALTIVRVTFHFAVNERNFIATTKGKKRLDNDCPIAR